MPQTLCRRCCALLVAALVLLGAGMALGGGDNLRATAPLAMDQHAHWSETD